MKARYALLTSCLTCLIFSQASAGEQGNIGVGVKAGTLGIGAEVDLGLNEILHLRGGANYLQFSFDSTVSNIDYEMEPEFKNASLLLDVYPFSGSFRITGGVFINNNEIALTGSPREEFWGDSTIPSNYSSVVDPLKDSIKLNGTVEFNTFAPYVGIGWNSNVEQERGWGVSFEMGVLFQGAPTVSSLTLAAAPPLDAYTDNPIILQALEHEKKAIEEDLDNFQYYPVASLMFHYTF
ncbi:hypothetical protein [Desulfogranum marinum]|uniref:hypothetical protein n=1 Tax=Desulfogranum marinum TaxID=453220 RepID=UPI0029C8328C|nr:hypothetical protein [Desulfogranum marinum]